ncbi:MAG: A/G-specific adenine glycosylase [Rhodospirillales bacterium]|nr:A/G-specific adenine glycosylase [Rhodospirillales bacterium]
MTNCNHFVDLLTWYDKERRELPWRAAHGETPEPYHVWLSEIMLQQTTVVTVIPYFLRFLEHWPTVEDMAKASQDDILVQWQGLGYYARARNLHKCAQHVANELNGIFPNTEAELLNLPGVGPYTAAAIASIAFDQKATVVDGNVERVMARIYKVEQALPGAKPHLKELAHKLTPNTRPGDYAQALMDLGATVCTPRNPICATCPWQSICQVFKDGTPTDYPKRAPKKKKPTRYGIVFYIENGEGELLLNRRPEKGLLGGMMELPGSDWREEEWGKEDVENVAPFEGEWKALEAKVHHTFTHFHLELTVVRGKAGRNVQTNGLWCPKKELKGQALPTVFKKVIELISKQ